MNVGFIHEVSQVQDEGADGYREYRNLLKEDAAVQKEDSVEQRPKAEHSLHFFAHTVSSGKNTLLKKASFPEAAQAGAQVC